MKTVAYKIRWKINFWIFHIYVTFLVLRFVSIHYWKVLYCTSKEAVPTTNSRKKRIFGMCMIISSVKQRPQNMKKTWNAFWKKWYSVTCRSYYKNAMLTFIGTAVHIPYWEVQFWNTFQLLLPVSRVNRCSGLLVKYTRIVAIIYLVKT